jgi:hypothetical protein
MFVVCGCLLFVDVCCLWVGSKNAVFWDDFTAVTMTNIFWGITPCGSSYCSSALSEEANQQRLHKQTNKQTPWLLVRKRIIPTEHPPLVGQI